MATRLQIAQLEMVTEIRELRLQRLLTEALVAYEQAASEVQLAERNLVQRQRDFGEAAIDFSRCPQSETVRVWHNVCQQRMASAAAEFERTQIECEEAQARLVDARRNVRRMQERGHQIITIGHSMRREAMRKADARSEDDLPTGSLPSLPLGTG